MRFADLDAVTVDGYGTLRHADRSGAEPRRLARASAGSIATPRSWARPSAPRSATTGRGRSTAGTPNRSPSCGSLAPASSCEAAGADIEPESFVDAFIASIRFEPIAGALETLASLRARGIDLAVVSNWDVGLEEHLERLGAARLFSTIVTSAEAGAAKPDPAIFRVALDRLGVDPARAVHIGDEPEDAEGAAAAGLGFLSVPLATAFEGWK